MKKLLVYTMIIGAVCLMGGCDDKEVKNTLSDISLLLDNEQPDSALALLDSLQSMDIQLGYHDRMLCRLYRQNAYNKLDTVFHSTDEANVLVEYFDDSGTPNERMLANYLLARAYQDIHEAPMALNYFHKATEYADTSEADCNYRQLSRVYGQMSDIFYQQNLIEESLIYGKKAIKCAWRGKDTLTAIRAIICQIPSYYNLSLVDSAIKTSEYASYVAEKCNYPRLSAIALGLSIRYLVEKGQLINAQKHMERYESESGYFDSDNNIEKGREVYYFSKGMYFLAVNELDSAEYFFRKELRDGKDFNNQNAGSRGLALLFQKTHQPDSAAKYALYSYAMNDSVYAQQTTEAIKRISSMYDYSRHKEIARQEKQKATTRLVYIWISAIVILLLTTILIVIVLYIQYVKQKRKGIEREYQHSLLVIEQAHRDLKQLQDYKDQNKQLIAEKEQLIHEQDLIRKTILKKEKASQEFTLRQFKTTSIYTTFCKLASTGRQPSETEWTLLQDAIFNAYPNFSELMSTHCLDLDEREYKVCLLIRADFKPNSISSMLAILPSVITQLRTGLYLKLFGKRGTSKEFDSLLRKIY